MYQIHHFRSTLDARSNHIRTIRLKYYLQNPSTAIRFTKNTTQLPGRGRGEAGAGAAVIVNVIGRVCKYVQALSRAAPRRSRRAACAVSPGWRVAWARRAPSPPLLPPPPSLAPPPRQERSPRRVVAAMGRARLGAVRRMKGIAAHSWTTTIFMYKIMT